MALKFIIRNAEVRKDIALVYRNQMAAECGLPSFVIIILTVSLFCKFFLALIMNEVYLNFRRDITETESWVILRAEDRSKAQVILSDDDRSSLAVYVEHLPALEPQCHGFFFVYIGRVEVVETRWHLCC